VNAQTRMTEAHLLHAQFAGPIVMICFGSIGRGVLPLLERHIGFDRSKFIVIAPDDSDRALLDERKLRFEKLAITKANHRQVLSPLLTGGPGRGMIVNLSVDTSSADLMDLCKDVDAHYIDTVCEPWPGLYTDRSRSISQRSNYALREGVLDVRRRRPGGVTAVSCCGANPGMVSWMVKQALIDVATELKLDFAEPTTRDVPIVALTSVSRGGGKQEDLGLNAVIPKPIDIDRVIHWMKRTCACAVDLPVL